jgi:hypothetical protein
MWFRVLYKSFLYSFIYWTSISWNERSCHPDGVPFNDVSSRLFWHDARTGHLGKTAQLWVSYMDHIWLVLQLTKAVKTNNFLLYARCLFNVSFDGQFIFFPGFVKYGSIVAKDWYLFPCCFYTYHVIKKDISFCFFFFCVLCTQCCQCLWFVPSFLPFSVFSNVYLLSFSSSCVLCTQCCQCKKKEKTNKTNKR